MTTLKEQKEREKTLRDKLSSFFFDLAKTTFAVMVVGNVVGIVGENTDILKTCAMALFGIVSTAMLAYVGYRTLKYKT